MNNKGQSLVLFVLIIPILIGIMVLVIDVGNTVVVKNKMNGVIGMVMEDSLDSSYSEDTIVKLLEYNLEDIYNTVKIEEDVIEIESCTYVEGVISKVFGFDGFRVVSKYRGYKENNKKVIEKVK